MANSKDEIQKLFKFENLQHIIETAASEIHAKLLTCPPDELGFLQGKYQSLNLVVLRLSDNRVALSRYGQLTTEVD